MARKTQTQTKKIRGRIPSDVNTVYAVFRATNGNVVLAAKRLNVTPPAIYQWLKAKEGRKETLAEIRLEHDDSLLDQAVTALMKNLKSIDGRVSNRAAEIAFRYIGKRRGYVPASYIKQNNREDVTVRVVRE